MPDGGAVIQQHEQHEDPQRPRKAAARRAAGQRPRVLVHSGGNLEHYYAQHFQGAVFPLAAGLLFYGWRALVAVALVLGAAAAAGAVWHRVGRRGRDMTMLHAMWMALTLALMLPPHLATFAHASMSAGVWLLPAAGILLTVMLWLLRGPAGTAVHPAVITYLLLAAAFHAVLEPRAVVQRERLFLGDVTDAASDVGSPGGANPWWLTRPRTIGHDAIHVTPASEALISYTLAHRDPSDRGTLLLQGLLRDRLPPLEDIVMAGNPGPIGTSSVIFVITGGLFLLYRGLIDWRIPLLIIATAFVALLVLPIPVAITDVGPKWSWLAMRDPSIGWAVAVTFANYELAASPLLFTAFFLATSATVRPITRRGRTIFAVAIGLLAAAMQLYVSVGWGPYAALLIVGLITPAADKLFQPRPLA
jgi:Na+-translocating ferredoxin:NAD+ oxidoreductase RnfD subunit